MTQEKLTLLVDADIPCYQIASSLERVIDDGDDWVSAYMDKNEAKQAFDALIEGWKKDTGATEVVMALTDKTNFRHEILAGYKANRSGARKPIGLSALKGHVADAYETVIKPGLEADDVLGILSTHPTLIPGKKVIISIDKDFKTIPGFLFNPNHPEDGIVEVSENEANYWHFYQTLVGDRVDNYSGCPGCGPKTAEKILAKSDDWWGSVVAAYNKAGLSETEALCQARVSRILRASDYDFTAKKPILWTPKQVVSGVAK